MLQVGFTGFEGKKPVEKEADEKLIISFKSTPKNEIVKCCQTFV
jgi:hypothetical protein